MTATYEAPFPEAMISGPDPGRTRVATLGGALAQAVADRGEDPFFYLALGRDEPQLVTYREIWLRALSVAETLRDSGTRPGDRIFLLLPNGVDYVAGFFGILLAGGTVVPWSPPGAGGSVDQIGFQIQDVLRDARPTRALTSQGWAEALGRLLGRPEDVLPIDGGNSEPNPGTPPAVSDPADPAIIQYFP